MSKFKVGDKAICINNQWTEHRGILRMNEIYTVKRVVHEGILMEFEEIDNNWAAARFIRANSHIIRTRLGIK